MGTFQLMEKYSSDLIQKADEDGDHWVSISDLMSGLMMVFLFISVVFMMQANNDAKEVVGIADKYIAIKDNIYTDMLDEFEADLVRWNAVLDKKTLALRFSEPNILFAQNSAIIEPDFKLILSDFFPRYVSILYPKYSDEIEEVRIEGYTSSEWANSNISPDEAYIKNMELSQSRTRSVLEHTLRSFKDYQKRDWLKTYLTANGLSSSKLILTQKGQENRIASRRVEFRIKTNAEKKIDEIVIRNREINVK